MTKRMKKSLMGLTAFSALMLCAGAAIAGGAMYAGAEEVTTNAKISVEESASLRIENFGLRFKTAIAADYWQDGMTVHTLMIPAPMLTGELTAATESVMDVTLDNAKKYQKGTDYYFNTVLTQIPQAQYGTQIAMRAYVEQNGVKEYAENTVSVSVAHVANAALEYSYETYVDDVAAYLVQGVNVSEKLGFEPGNSANLNAGISYFEEASEAVKGKLNSLYTLSYQTSDGSVATVSENGEVTAVANGTANITVTINELNVSAVCAVTVSQPEWGELIDFNNIDLSKLAKSHSTQSFEAVEKDGKNAIKFTVNGTWAVLLVTPPEQFETYSSKFDYLSVKVSVETVGEGVVTGASMYGANPNTPALMPGGSTSSGVKEIIYGKSKFTDGNVVNSGRYKFTCNVWNSAAVTNFYIYSMQFGYDDIAADNEENTTFNLTERFGVAASELKNVMFNGEAVADITAFAPTQSGALTFTVEKDGFASTDFSVNVTYSALKAGGLYEDFSNFDTSIVSFTNATTKDNCAVSISEEGYLHVTEKDTVNGNEDIQMKFLTGAYKSLIKYDYLEFKCRASFAGAAAVNMPIQLNYKTINLQRVDASGVTNLSNNWFPANNNWFTFRIPLSVFTWSEQFASELVFTITKWNNGDLTLDFEYFKGGYNDIESDGATAIDLTSKFDATAEELTATFTPAGGTAAVIADKAAWVPAENGVLTVTIKRSGYKAVTYTLNVTVTAGA